MFSKEVKKEMQLKSTKIYSHLTKNYTNVFQYLKLKLA